MFRTRLGTMRAALLGSLGSTLAVSCGGSTTNEPGTTVEPGPGGYAQTSGGFWHRPAVGACEDHRALASDGGTPNPGVTSCVTDADCAGVPFGYCAEHGVQGVVTLSCSSGCLVDSDCPAGNICRCGDNIGRCVPASCVTDADCAGALCLERSSPHPCGGADLVQFQCGVPKTECKRHSDCADSYQNCVAGACENAVCGRPFFVAGKLRRAEAASRADWAAAEEPSLDAVDPEARALLAEHWLEIGLMEHASVAAFARFTLQALSLAADWELVADSQRALADEIDHARLAFGFAARYGGRPLGPAALPLAGALDDSADLVSIAHSAFVEMCIGETCASAEAAAAADVAREPEVRDALERIFADELRHAALGYRFLQWALARATDTERSQLQRLCVAELQRALASVRTTAASAPAAHPHKAAPVPSLEDHGVLCPARRESTRAAALADVVVPCVRALLATASAPTRVGARAVDQSHGNV